MIHIKTTKAKKEDLANFFSRKLSIATLFTAFRKIFVAKKFQQLIHTWLEDTVYLKVEKVLPNLPVGLAPCDRDPRRMRRVS